MGQSIMENKFVDIFYKVGYECLRLYDDPQQRPGQIMYPDERRLWHVDDYECKPYDYDSYEHVTAVVDGKALILADDEHEAFLFYHLVKIGNLRWKFIFINDIEAHMGYFTGRGSVSVQ